MRRLLILPLILTMMLDHTAYAKGKEEEEEKKKKKHYPSAQNILTIIERRNKKTVDTVSGLHIVDINSTLTITVDRKILMQKTNRYLNIDAEEKLQELNKYTHLMKNHNKLMKDVIFIMADTSKNEDLLDTYTTAMDSYKDMIQEDSVLAKDMDKVYRAGREKNFDLFVMKYIEEKHTKALKALDSIYLNERVQFSLAAFRANAAQTPIHIENYDKFENGQYFEVPRWVTNLSEEDTKTLEEYTKVAKEWNETNENFISYFSSTIKGSFKSFDKIKPIKEKIDALQNTIKQMSDEHRMIAEQFIADTKQELSTLGTSLEKFDDVKITTPFEVLNGDLRSIQAILDTFTISFNRRLDSLKEQLQADYDKIKTNATAIHNDIKELKKAVETDLATAQNLITSIKDYYNLTRNIHSDNQEISDKVNKFDMSTLPETGYIDLKYTGQRIPGDEIIIRFILRQQVGKSLQTDNVTLERRILKMQKIGVYNETCVSLVMTTPTNMNMTPALENDFQFSPSAGFIFKFGTRNSRFVNFMEPGLGLNFTTTDFNLDGTPEFGSGVAVTLLRNTVLGGWNYNFVEDVPYWFIGINLPIRSGNLLGQGIDTRYR